MKPAFWGLTVVISEIASSCHIQRWCCYRMFGCLKASWYDAVWICPPIPTQWQRKVEVCMYLSCVTMNRLIFDSSRMWGWTWVNLRHSQHSLTTVWLNFPSFPLTVPYPNTSINIKKPPKNFAATLIPVALVNWGEFKSRKNSKSSTTW